MIVLWFSIWRFDTSTSEVSTLNPDGHPVRHQWSESATALDLVWRRPDWWAKASENSTALKVSQLCLVKSLVGKPLGGFISLSQWPSLNQSLRLTRKWSWAEIHHESGLGLKFTMHASEYCCPLTLCFRLTRVYFTPAERWHWGKQSG